MKNFLFRKKAQEVAHVDSKWVERPENNNSGNVNTDKNSREKQISDSILLRISLLIIGNIIVIILCILCYYLL